MFKKSLLGSAVALAIALPNIAAAEVETSVILKNETAAFFKKGIRTGEATSTLDNKGDGRKIGKFENSARIFFNGDVGEESSWHGELNLIYDPKATSGYKGHKNYTQNDWFRELYVDTNAGGWDLRLGKQQVVWGTADGIKLLDIINPTDWREFVQNTMEDSRIPVWMINAERNVGENGNIQFVISQAASSKIPGLTNTGNRSAEVIYNDPLGTNFGTQPPGSVPPTPSDNSQLRGSASGHPFIMKGVDTIIGKVNGFFNIGAAMGAVTRTFFNGNFISPQIITPGPPPTIIANQGRPEIGTVGGYTAGRYKFSSNTNTSLNCTPYQTAGTFVSGANCLAQFTQATNQSITNLIDTSTVTDQAGTVIGTTGAGWDTTNPNSTWEYMPGATFATFNPFVGMTTRFERKMPKSTDMNFGMRYRGSLDNGLNFGINYLYAYDPNPVINIHWADPNTGERLVYKEYKTIAGTVVGQLSNQAGTRFYGANANYTNGSPGDKPVDPDGPGPAPATTNLYAGPAPTDVTAANNAGPAQLVFTERLTRVHNIGTSFDYAFDTGDQPVVLRGEFLYQKNVHQPIVDRDALGRGNLTAALTTKKSDFFKYVIGVDTTVMTNLFTSFQFIQFINLDFVDQKKTCQYFDSTGAAHNYNCSRYTANPATMHLTNGLQKGRKTQEFYSFFLSKPFGESDLGRWNNIVMFEEGGGFWDRLDAEYSLSDELSVTGEINMYWGSQNTMFGQFKNSSNIQVGLKYIIE